MAKCFFEVRVFISCSQWRGILACANIQPLFFPRKIVAVKRAPALLICDLAPFAVFSSVFQPQLIPSLFPAMRGVRGNPVALYIFRMIGSTLVN